MDLNSLKWSEPKLVVTAKGPRLLSKTILPKGFWDLWSARKNELRAAGYSPSKDKAGMWELCRWQEPNGQSKTEAVAASRALDAVCEIPLSVRARERGFDYMGFQRAGIKFMSQRPATLLGDDMGVGKTIQIIGTMNANGVEVAVVVCPQSMLLTWAKTLFVWLVKPLPVYVVMKGKEISEAGYPGINSQVKLTTEFPQITRGIIVINWDILHKHADALRSRVWDLVAFDESQYGKNQNARRARYAFGYEPSKKALAEGAQPISPIQGKIRICASGTPWKNRPIELFTQVHYLDPQAWPSYYKYATRYCGAHRTRFGFDVSGASNLPELQERLRSSIMIRRMKSEVLTDLPPKTRQVISIPSNGCSDMVKAEQLAHEEWLAAKQSGDQRRLNIAFTALAEARMRVGEAKIPFVLSHIEEIEQKTVIFCRHKEVQAKLAEALQEHGVVIYNGDMSPAKKEEAKVAFQTNASIQYFIGTITSCGVGLDLFASSYCVFAELEWSPADLNQAEDRLWRKGQTGPVLIHHVVFDGSVDDRMLISILQKQKDFDAGMDTQTVEEPKKAPEPFILPEEKAQEPRKPELIPGVAREKFAPLLSCLRLLSGMCDGARQLDGAGFNKVDSYFGKELARQESLSPRQALYAHKMVRKYKKQLPADLYESIYPPKAKDEEE